MDACKTAFIYLHAQAGPDYFADVPFAWTAGELRALGLPADVLHVHFERDQPKLQEQLLDELVERLREGRYRLAVLEHCWLPTLVKRLQSELEMLVCETEPFAVHPGARVDFVLHHFTDHRQPLIDLVIALRDGTDLLDVRNLRIHQSGQSPTHSRIREPHPSTPDALRPFCPVIDRITIGVPIDERGEQHPVRKTLDTNKGCPFSDQIIDNRVFADVTLTDPSISMAGCAFCPMGGDYVALPWRKAVEKHLDHIAYYQQRMPQLDEIVLRDQHAIRYAPELLKGAIARGLRPFGLLVPGRGDAILRFGEAMQEASEAAAGTGFWWTIYLIGFESFSQPQLDLYNKGVTVDQYGDALRQMRALHRRFPDGFRLYAAGASSFILFSPWTTLDDLRANVDFCKQHAVWRLARGLTTTRMRLYPNLPLYHKAKHDGLLRDFVATDGRGAAHTGYAAEAGWVYRDTRVAVVENLHERLRRHCNVDELVGLLDTCERHVRRCDGTDVDQIEAHWIELRRLWRKDKAALAATSLSTIERKQRASQIRSKAERTVLVGRHCNNHCRTCIAEHAQHQEDEQRLAQAVKVAASDGRVTVAGREPLLLAGLPRLLRSTDGARRIELVSNGRALASPRVATKLQRAGVTDLLLKRHRLADVDEDNYCRADGAGAQFWRGIEQLAQQTPSIRWRLLLIVTTEGIDELSEIADKALLHGAAGVQLKVMAGAVDLARLPEVTSAITRVLQRHDAQLDGF